MLNKESTHAETPKSWERAADTADQTVEAVALAGAAAIQRLIAERDSFYHRMNSYQRDLAAQNAINGELRRRLSIVRYKYVEVARTILAQLEQLDKTTREAIGANLPPHAATDAKSPADDYANVHDLSQRFNPGGTKSAVPSHFES
jgi:hypothetical protein